MLGKDFVSEMNDWEAWPDEKEEPSRLVILGEFARGKHCIINALLGKELAPINVTPETYTINDIFGHTQACYPLNGIECRCRWRILQEKSFR